MRHKVVCDSEKTERTRERESERERERELRVLWEQEKVFYVLCNLKWKRSVENKATQKLNYISMDFICLSGKTEIKLLIYSCINLNLMYFLGLGWNVAH